MTGTSTPADPHENRAFLRRVTAAVSWGQGLDGYDLGILSVVITLAGAELGISTGWQGNDGTAVFRPVTPIARDAIAAFLYRFDSLELLD